MPSMKDTKRRIVSVKNTQKITRAMKLVSAAKYARANQAAINSRPYGESFERMVARLSEGAAFDAPLLKKRPEKTSILVITATDRGLCGGLNSNLLKSCSEFLNDKKSQGVSVKLSLWGKRAVLFGQKRDEEIIDKREKILEKPSYDFALKSAKTFSNSFVDAEIDRLYIAYPKFVNALSQEPTIDCILPAGVQSKEEPTEEDFILEPSKEALLNSLLTKQIANRIFRFFLEGSASEHAARMTAMDNASNNADEVIKRLTLEYNRARQAAITKELIEITSGADAL